MQYNLNIEDQEDLEVFVLDENQESGNLLSSTLKDLGHTRIRTSSKIDKLILDNKHYHKSILFITQSLYSQLGDQIIKNLPVIQIIYPKDMGEIKNPANGYISNQFNKNEVRLALQVAKIKIIYMEQISELFSKVHAKHKLVRIGEFAGSIVHDINNFNSIIQGNFILIDRLSNNSKDATLIDINKYSKKGFIGSQRIENLTERYRKIMFSEDHSDVEEIDLCNLLDEVEQYFEIKFNQGSITYKHDLKKDFKVRANSIELLQCFINLVSNSTQELQKIPKNNRAIEITHQCSGSTILLKIQDTGSGVPKEFVNKIFDPFTSSKKKEGGMGLGLNVVKSLLEKNGGKISYDIASSKTTFLITLPLLKSF